MTAEQTEEYIKCRRDPTYYLKTYGKVRHPTKGLLTFALWNFQEECVSDFLSHSYNVILKARQLGLSTLCAGYVSWMMTFFKNKEIYIIATKADTATNLVSKIKVFLENMPDWMQPKLDIDNRRSIELSNGSKVKAATSTADSARSEALSLLIIDEAAFIKNMDDIWIAAQPTLSTGGDCIALSTPNGMGNWFHRTYADAQVGQKFEMAGKMVNFNSIRLHWSLHPDRNQKWADDMRTKIGQRAFAQEHDCDFLQSGNNVIDVNDLKWYEENPTTADGHDITECPHVREPIEKTGFDKGFWIWKYPDYTRQYLVSADVSRGDGSDYSTCQVIDVENYEQVAEYKGKVPTDAFGHLLVQIAVQYNNALLVPENNSIGWATIQKIIDLNYSNLYWTDKTKMYVDVTRTTDIYDPYDKNKKSLVPGFTTSSRTRPTMIARMEEDIRNHEIELHSMRLLKEFETYIFENGKPDHMQGYNDDLIMALAIGMFVRNTNLKIHELGGEMQRTMLNNISSVNNPYELGVIKPEDYNKVPEQYTMKTRQSEENLLWLL